MIVYLTAVIAAATVIYTIVAGYTLHEIHSGSADTHALAVAAKTQAEKMKDVSDAANDIKNAARDMASHEEKIAENAEKALAASNRQARAALDASIEASRIDQRAWVSLESADSSGMESVTSPEDMKTHNGIVFIFRFKNTGKTPATKVAFDATLEFREPGNPIPDYVMDPHETYTKMTGVRESALIGPGDAALFTFPPAKAYYLSANETQLLESRRTILYIVGKLTYHDVFKGTPERSTKFCGIYVPGDKRVAACPINRSMD